MIKSCVFSVIQQLLVSSYEMNVRLADQYILLCKLLGGFVFLKVAQWNNPLFLIILVRNGQLFVELRYILGPRLVLSLLRPPLIQLIIGQYRRRISRRTEFDTPVDTETE